MKIVLQTSKKRRVKAEKLRFFHQKDYKGEKEKNHMKTITVLEKEEQIKKVKSLPIDEELYSQLVQSIEDIKKGRVKRVR